MNYVHVLDIAIPAKYALRCENDTQLLYWLAALPDYDLRRWMLLIPNSFVVR